MARPLPWSLDIVFMSFFISRNCLSSALTSWTSRPAPLAMRRRREPLIFSGVARSYGVIDWIKRLDVAERVVVDVDRLELLADARDHAQEVFQRPHVLDLLELVVEVLEVELLAAELALQLFGLLLVELLLGLLDERDHVAHPRMRWAIRSG